MAQVSAQKCSYCDLENGEFFCYECQHVLCAVCLKTHGKIPALIGHTIAGISQIDLSIINRKSQCTAHKKEFLYYCVKCSVFICSKCVLSSHNTHPVSEISNIVYEEREKAKENIHELKSKIDTISSLQNRIRDNHLAQLHDKSKHSFEQIESISKELQTFIESNRSIKQAEVKDNEKKEQQQFEAFLEKTDLVHKQYTKILSELENLLLEKHDVTFYTCYRLVLSDMHTLVNIPEEPALAEVPILEDTFLYKKVLEYSESKIGTSLCQNCTVLRMKFEDLHKEYKRLKETYQSERRSSSILIFARYSSKGSPKELTIDETKGLVDLFKQLSCVFKTKEEYLTFTHNGKQYHYDPNDRRQISDICMHDRNTIFIVSKVLIGTT